MSEQATYRTIDKFDRMMGALANLPDVSQSKPSTVVAMSPLIGEAQTFIVQTFRQTERDQNSKGEEVTRSKDTVFMQYVDGEGRIRLVIPHQAIDAIIRQRDALTTKIRKRIGKQQAQARKARGETPAFLKMKKHKTA
jgi:hypothetical protein